MSWFKRENGEFDGPGGNGDEEKERAHRGTLGKVSRLPANHLEG